MLPGFKLDAQIDEVLTITVAEGFIAELSHQQNSNLCSLTLLSQNDNQFQSLQGTALYRWLLPAESLDEALQAPTPCKLEHEVFVPFYTYLV